MNPRYSVIIPAYNEQERIEETIRSYARVFSDSEIIVVLNGCTDGTAARVRLVQHTFENVQCVEIPHAVGKGGAVRAGFLVARSSIVGFADADGATTAPEMRRLFESLGSDDGIIGSRWMRGARVFNAQPFARRVASRVFNMLVRLLFGLNYHDTQCGAKVFRADALQSVITKVQTSNMAFDVDLLYALRCAGYRIVETATEWRDVHGSSVRLASTSAKMFASLIRLRLHQSFLRLILPLFDKVFPTQPIRAHDGLRILILNWRDPMHPQAGGAETYLFEMAKYWLRWGSTVEWLTASFKGAQPTETLEGVRITRVGNRFTVYALLPLMYLRRFRNRFDIIIDSENGIPFFSPAYSMKPKICVMHHVHQRVFRTYLPFPASEFVAWLERWVMPRVYANTQFVAVSNDTRVEMQSYNMSALPIEIIHNGVDAALIPGTKSPIPTVLYFGRLKPYKRVDLLIEAFARVVSAVPNAVLRIAGAGDTQTALQHAAERCSIAERVIFEGYVTEDRKHALLQEAWVLVNPSSMEGWGISVIEANACATPAIAFRVPGLREAIRDGVTGLLVEEGDDLSVPLSTLLRDSALRARLANGALNHATSFSWRSSAERFFDVMLHTIAGDTYSIVRTNGHWMVVRGCNVALQPGDTSSPKAALAVSMPSMPVLVAQRGE